MADRLALTLQSKRKLNNGVEIPVLGLGVYQAPVKFVVASAYSIIVFLVFFAFISLVASILIFANYFSGIYFYLFFDSILILWLVSVLPLRSGFRGLPRLKDAISSILAGSYSYYSSECLSSC